MGLFSRFYRARSREVSESAHRHPTVAGAPDHAAAIDIVLGEAEASPRWARGPRGRDGSFWSSWS